MTEIERIKCGMVNCWLLKGKGGGVLVDTAVPRFKEKILKAVRGANVKLIFLTHGHADHISGAAYLARELGVPVAMHADDIPLIEDQHYRTIRADNLLGRLLMPGSDESRYRPRKFKPDIKLKGGEMLREYGIDAQCAALPGHTAGSIGVMVNRRDFIVGDTFFNIFKPTRALLYENPEQLSDSVELVKMSRCSRIYPGHGKPFAAELFFQ